MLLEAEKDRKWFESRRPEFEERYKGMFVAVKNRDVVAASPDLEETMAQIRKKDLDPALVIVEFISTEGVGTLL